MVFNELYKLYNKPYIVKMMKVGRFKWLVYLFRMQEHNPCRKLTLHKPEGVRRVDRPAVRWLNSVEEYLENMAVRT
jgi:hypothetical protein